MRIAAHLCGSRPRLAWPLAALAWLVALGGMAFAAWLVAQALELRAEQPRLEVRLQRAQAQLAAAGAREPLAALADLEALRERVQVLNRLSDLRGWATPQFLAWLGTQLPDNVYLVSLYHKPRDGEALLVAESPSAEALTHFLLRLEREPRFGEVLLAKQGSHAEAGAAAVQFEIRVRWKQ
jgi:hypothetical protein